MIDLSCIFVRLSLYRHRAPHLKCHKNSRRESPSPSLKKSIDMTFIKNSPAVFFEPIINYRWINIHFDMYRLPRYLYILYTSCTVIRSNRN